MTRRAKGEASFSPSPLDAEGEGFGLLLLCKFQSGEPIPHTNRLLWEVLGGGKRGRVEICAFFFFLLVERLVRIG